MAKLRPRTYPSISLAISLTSRVEFRFDHDAGYRKLGARRKPVQIRDFFKNKGLTVRKTTLCGAMLAALERRRHALSHWRAHEAVTPLSQVRSAPVETGRVSRW